MYRYLAVRDAELCSEMKIIVRSNSLETVERSIQHYDPKDIVVYEAKYVSENVLCKVGYEDESNDSDALSDVTPPAADHKVAICGCSTPEKWNDVISHPHPING